jgi:cytochrome P460
MNGRSMRTIAIVTALVRALGASALSAQDKDGGMFAAILANPVMIDAYRAGVPGNGKPFPDGSRMAKIHSNPTQMETFPAATVPGTLHDVDFMAKDSKRFADSGGWGWAVFEYEAAAATLHSGPAPRPTSRRRGTTPRVDSRATRS